MMLFRSINGCLLVAALGFGAPVALAEQASILLNDGSQILGEVVSLKGGYYKVKTSSLGEIDLKQGDVKLIRYGQVAQTQTAKTPAPAASATASASNPQLASMFQGVQQRISSDPQMMQKIQSMAQDPTLQAILNDPEIKRALESGDFGSLMANPKIHQLMNHSTVKQITQQMK